MNIDEAIAHAEEVADSRCDACGTEHRQLAEWLKELKALKEEPRAKGEWEERKEYSYGWLLRNLPDEKLEQIQCSVCGRWCEHTKGHIPHNYCPHCGADMRGEQNEPSHTITGNRKVRQA